MPITMYDSITPRTVPSTASTSHDAVAGYVGGHWPDYWAMVKAFPRDHHLSIAVNAHEDADCLDIEAGDAVPAQGPAWVHRQHARGVARPVLYANLSTMPAVIGALNAAGIARASVRLWVADFMFDQNRAQAMLAEWDAVQWTDRALGRNLDASLCRDDFFATHTVTHTVSGKVVGHSVRFKAVKAVVKAVKKLVPAKPHPKVVASGLVATIVAAVVSVLHAEGVHVDPQLSLAIEAVASAFAGYMAPGKSPSA